VPLALDLLASGASPHMSGVYNGTMRWPAYSLYEFKRDYGRAPPSAHVVWPVLSRIDELE